MTGSASDGRRSKRLAELVRLHLSEVIRRETDDPELAGVVVTNVEVTPDLSIATLHVRLLTEDTPEARKKLLTRLKRASSVLRRGLAGRLDMRKAPELRFLYDTGHDKSRRVDELLDEIKRDKRGDD